MRDEPRDRNAELLRDADGRRVLAGSDDQQLGAEVGEIELEFVGTIGRIERRGRRGRANAQERRRHLRTVVEHDADAIARADTLRRERCGDVRDERAKPR